MRLVWFAGLVGLASAVAIARPDAVDRIYQHLYPSDPMQRLALDHCSLENRGFDRSDPAAREACYRRGAAVSSAGAEQRAMAPVNFVDQWRAAGLGHLPPNDIRAEQRDARYLRGASAGPNR